MRRSPLAASVRKTLILVYLLIAVGALVRASGAGMGCPDWPLCFGLWIPPLDVSQLPPQYDPSQFNVVKTWTEYLNRLLGVLVGIAALATWLRALGERRSQKRVFAACSAGLLAVIFAGWLGSRVVRTELSPIMVTTHLLAALSVVFCYVAAEVLLHYPLKGPRRRLWNLSGFILVLLLLQLFFGTFLRTTVALGGRFWALNALPRGELLGLAGWVEPAHRALAIFIALMIGVQYLRLRNSDFAIRRRLGFWSLALVLLQLALALVLVRMHLPVFLQVLHLWNATLLIGSVMALFLLNGSSHAEQRLKAQ